MDIVRLQRTLMVFMGGTLLLHAPVVHAAPHRLCIQWNWLAGSLGYRDASPRPGPNSNYLIGDINPNEDAGEDYGRRDQLEDYRTNNMLAQVTANDEVLWGWRPLDGEGCTEVFETDAESVTLEYRPWSIWSGTNNQIITLDCDSSAVNDCELRGETKEVPLDLQAVDTVFYNLGAAGPLIVPFLMHWGMSFSEKRQSVQSNHTVYGASWDPMTAVPTVTNLNIARRPTVNMRGLASAQRKYTVAHEYGHAQTLADVLDQVMSADYLNYCYPNVCGPSNAGFNHTFTSEEWQGAAAAEGFAHYYAMAVWNNMDEATGVWARPGVTNGLVDDAKIQRFATDDLPTSCHANHAMCDGNPNVIAPAGTAIERDWAFFLWDITAGSAPVSTGTALSLLSQTFPWPAPPAVNNDWWLAFEAVAAANLTPAELLFLQQQASLREVDF